MAFLRPKTGPLRGLWFLTASRILDTARAIHSFRPLVGIKVLN